MEFVSLLFLQNPPISQFVQSTGKGDREGYGGRGRNRGGFGGGGRGHGIRSMLPSRNDPNLWKVKCAV